MSKQKSVDSVVTVCSLDMDMTDHEPGPGPAAPHQTVFTHSYTPHTLIHHHPTQHYTGVCLYRDHKDFVIDFQQIRIQNMLDFTVFVGLMMRV